MVRPAIGADLNFIFSSWLKSYRNSDWAKPMHNNVYYTAHHALIEDLLTHSQVYVACSVANQADIFGWAVAQRIKGIFTVHYVYVKHTFRQMGIANLLMKCFDRAEDEASCYTHHTHLAKKLASPRGFLYNPYLLSQIEEQKEQNYYGVSDAVEEKEPAMDVSTEEAQIPANNIPIQELQNRIRNLEAELEEAKEALSV